MIVPSELQDLPETIAPESSAGSSVDGDSDNHCSSASRDSSTEGTPSEVGDAEEGAFSPPTTNTEVDAVVFEEWENKVISGRLDNLRKAPKTLPAGFRFRAALHHEVVDSSATVKGYKKLKEMVRQYQIPRTILIQAGTQNERACIVSRMGWVPIYIDHFEVGLRFPLPELIFDVLAKYKLALMQLTPNSIKFIIGFMLLCERLEIPVKTLVFRLLFLCCLCPSTSGTRWYYISRREKMMIFTNIKNKVARWKRQFIFFGDTWTEKMNNELTTRAKGLVDLEALVILEQLALLGFVDVTNLYAEGEMSSILERQRQRAQNSKNRGAGLGSQRQARFDERPPTAPSCSSSQREQGSSLVSRSWAKRTSSRAQPVSAAATRSTNMPPVPAHDVAEPAPASTSVSGPKIAYPEGFNYVRTDYQAAMVQGMHSFVPLADRQRAKGHVQQHGGHAVLLKLMDVFSYTIALFECEQEARGQNRELQQSCKQLAFEKASLEDEDEAGHAEDQAKRAESDKDKTLYELNSLKDRVAKANQNVARAEASLEKIKKHHQHSICIARAQGAEWLVGADMFQDVVAVASANTTMDIYNEIRGKVLRHWADFPIGELAFFEGEEMDEQGKSLAPPSDATVRLKWELNEGVLVWPPSMVEKGEDTKGLPSFDAWVAEPLEVQAEPSSTPPSFQPVVAPALLSPAQFTQARSSPARPTPAPTDVSIPVDLTDD
ncbi:hypothetical protein SLEP1_g18753 [Rubroshorea leprosula]|uniref:Transposase (putative) gypsy type domain-containing protein n=1 Tax=Rubroshorea leprosula TaxID=152421 RepID=A0AAV5IYL0_9ROSI|nr:hypothetical protein SLEP1_g18753 [Rubroshorea leprosula]